MHDLNPSGSVPTIEWYDNDQVAPALDVAKATGRPLLVIFWHPDCLGCAKLFAHTCANDAVQAFLAEQVVAITYNTTRPNDWYRRLNGHVAHFWHPHVVVVDSHLAEGRRVIGYFEPDAFIAQVQLGMGMLHMYHRNFAMARAAFSAATKDGLPDNIIAEALYWRGVAAYRISGTEDLRRDWSELRHRYPALDWSQRADCLDVTIPGVGFDPSDPSSVTLDAKLA